MYHFKEWFDVTNQEILKKVIEFVEAKDEKGYNEFIKTLSKEQNETLQKTLKSVDNFLKKENRM